MLTEIAQRQSAKGKRMTKSTMNDSQEHTMSVYVVIARQMVIEQKLEVAETFYKRALGIAEKISDNNSPLSGTILIELFYLYQDAGRELEATLMWKRVRDIFIAYSSNH